MKRQTGTGKANIYEPAAHWECRLVRTSSQTCTWVPELTLAGIAVRVAWVLCSQRSLLGSTGGGSPGSGGESEKVQLSLW